MANGRKTGGRNKGTPNRVTSTARQAFLATFGRLEDDLETWIRQTAEGWDEEVTVKGKGPDGASLTAIVRKGKDPGKAADLLIRMAEYHFPKLGRTEVTGADGEPLTIEIRKYDPNTTTVTVPVPPSDPSRT